MASRYRNWKTLLIAMEIDGPLRIGIVTQDNSLDREIHVDFTDAFQRLTLQEQGQVFSQYVRQLKMQSEAITQDNQERQGMLVVLQVAEQLMPHVQAGEIPLNETIVVEVNSESVLGNLISGRSLN